MARKRLGEEPSRERRAEVLLEELKGKFGALLDGHVDIVRQLDRLETKTDASYKEFKQFMTDGFEKVYQDFEGVDGQFAAVHSRLDVLASRFDAHEQAHRN
jgi:hypothetical protein